MGTWEHIKLGELPRHNALELFCWGRFLKIQIQIQIKSELFTLQVLLHTSTYPRVGFHIGKKTNNYFLIKKLINSCFMIYYDHFYMSEN
jgi:hypothetical protein